MKSIKKNENDFKITETTTRHQFIMLDKNIEAKSTILHKIRSYFSNITESLVNNIFKTKL